MNPAKILITPSLQNQAIDRVHRIGQVRPVKTVRLIVKDSIEANMLEIQKRKAQLCVSRISKKLAVLADICSPLSAEQICRYRKLFQRRNSPNAAWRIYELCSSSSIHSLLFIFDMLLFKISETARM